MSNLAPADPENIVFLRKLVSSITPDMVERGLIAYHNYQAMNVVEIGHYVSSDSDPQLIEAILRAALIGDT